MPKKCPWRFGLPEKKQGCIEHGCEFFVNLVGTNPNTNEEQNEWGCSIRWLPLLLVENASKIRQVAASTDKVATAVNSAHETFGNLALEAAQRVRLRQADSTPQITNGQTEE